MLWSLQGPYALSIQHKDLSIMVESLREHFFRAQHTRESDKVWLASFHMTSIAQHWYYMLERDMGGIHAITWTQFCTLCQQRFGPPLGTNHLADLARLQYNGTVPKYQEAFQARMAHAGYLSQAQEVQLFTGGLPDSIRIDVELQSPEDLQRAMYLARAYERRTVMHTTPTATRPSRFPPQPASQSPVAPSVSPATTPTTTTTQAPPRPFKTLSPSEMAERRRQGLCYNCDEQYVKGHKCPRLFYLEVSDFDDQVPETKGSESNPGDLPPLISLHAITGIHSVDTMQVKVGIRNHQFTALLDSGSTRNFISESAAQHVELCLSQPGCHCHCGLWRSCRLQWLGARNRYTHWRGIFHSGLLHHSLELLRYGPRCIVSSHLRANFVGLR